MVDVARWLDELGLGNYAPAFVENNVDSETLSHLTSEDLREIGVVSVSHRRKLLAAITALGEDNARQSTTGSPRVSTRPT